MSTLQVTGASQVKRFLLTAPAKLVKKIERKALRQAAKPVLDAAKQLVPKDERDLERTLAIRALKRSRTNTRLGVVGVRVTTDEKKLQAMLDESGGVFNPHWIEFGAPGHKYYGKGNQPLPEQPFMRPAADQSQGAVRAIFHGTLRQIITELAAEGGLG